MRSRRSELDVLWSSAVPADGSHRHIPVSMLRFSYNLHPQIDGDRPMDEVFASICDALDTAQERKHASAQQDTEAQTA